VTNAAWEALDAAWARVTDARSLADDDVRITHIRVFLDRDAASAAWRSAEEPQTTT
jgi:hypothetical protein